MATINDLLKVFKEQRDAVYRKGGQMNIKGTNVSPKDILDGINSIPQTLIQTGNYAVQCTETANTTFTISKDGTIIDTKTNDATKGGSVVFNLTTTGTYSVTATQGGIEKWTTTVGVATVGTVILKSPKPIREYTEAEIDLAAKNNYAKYMFNPFDYIDDESFMGSTDAKYKRRYIIGFDDFELADSEGVCGIVWYYPKTPSTSYTVNETYINNTSWEGSYLRHNYFLQNNVDYYVYDSTVTDTTAGTYYIHSDGEWVEKTLPAEFVDTEDYYTKKTTTADGTIWLGILESIRNRMVKVKTKTWRGCTNQVNKITNYALRFTDKVITSKDYIFPLSGQEGYGDRPELTAIYEQWNYNKNEGDLLSGFKETGKRLYNYFDLCANFHFWLRSPNTYAPKTWDYWSGNNGSVNNISAPNTNAVGVCFCQ